MLAIGKPTATSRTATRVAPGAQQATRSARIRRTKASSQRVVRRQIRRGGRDCMEARLPLAPTPCRPLGYPGATSPHGLGNPRKGVSVPEQVDRFPAPGVLTEIRRWVFPVPPASGLGESTRNRTGLRSLGGILVYDVMAVTQ